MTLNTPPTRKPRPSEDATSSFRPVRLPASRMRRASAGKSLPTSSVRVSRSSSIREYSIWAIARGSLPSACGGSAGAGCGSIAPRLTREAEGTRSICAEPHDGHDSSERCF